MKLRTRRRRVLAAAVAICAAAALLLAAGIAALHTQAFRDWARQQIIAEAEKSTGARVQVSRFEFGLSPLAADLYGIVVHGNESSSAPPLLRAERLRVVLQWRPLMHHQVQIDSVEIEKPQVFVQADANGRTNLPAPPAAKSASGFRIAVGHAAVRNGSLIYNDETIPLNADLYGVQGELRSLALPNNYEAQLRYDSGRILAENFNPLQHSLFVRAIFAPTQCKIDEFKLAMRQSQIEAAGVLDNFSAPRFAGTYRARLAGGDVGFFLKNTGIPSGDVSLEGNLHYTALEKEASFLTEMSSQGTFESSELLLRQAARTIPVNKLHGSYALQNGELQLKDVRGELLGGALLSASDTININTSFGRLQAELKNVSLPDAGRTLDHSGRLPRIASRANAQAGMKWKGGVENALLELKAQFSSRGVPRKPEDIPLDGNLDASYDLHAESAVIRNSVLRTGATELSASGTLAKRSQLNVSFRTSNLHELIAIASEQGAAEEIRNAKLEDLRGAASFSGTIAGSVSQPRMEGRLSGTDVALRGSEWQSIQANLKADPTGVQLSRGVLQGPQGRIQLAGTIPLSDWKPNMSAGFSADIGIQKLSLAAVQQLAGSSYPAKGLLNAEIQLNGSIAQPKGTAHVDLLQGVIYGEALSAMTVQARADGRSIHLDAQARADAGSVKASVSFEPGSRRYQVNGEVQNLTPSKLSLANEKLGNVEGAISAKFSGSGTLDNPQLKGTVQSEGLQIRGEAVKNIQAQLDLQNHHAEFEVSSLIAGNQISGKGTVALEGNYPATISVDTGSVNVGPLLQTYASAGAEVSGDLEVHATANGPLKEPEKMEAHLEIPRLQLTGKDVTVTNVRPIRIQYANGTVNILDAAVKGPGTDLSASGSVSLQGNGGMNLSAKGNLDFKILQGWISGASAAGQAQMQVSVRGTREKPDISGNVQISDVAFSSDSLPVGIESLNGAATLQGRRIRIEKLSGTVGGGNVTVGGTVDLGANPAYALTLTAKSTRIRQNGVRAIVDASLNFSGRGSTQMLDGRVVARRLNFEQGSDLDGIIAQFSGDNTVSAPSPLEQKIKLNVSVQSDQELGLASSQLSVSGSANLQIVGTLADPVALGRIALTGGEVFFLSKRFALQNGTIVFANTTRTTPIVNMDVGTTVEQYNLTIHLSGTLDKLKTTYTSDPSLSSADIINLLAFGQTTAEQQSKSTAPGSLGAESAIASAAGGQLAGQLQRVAGISQLTIDPLAGNSQNPGAQIAIQQRVTGNLLVTFATDVTSAQTQTVQVLYQIKPNVTVSILRDENGGYGLDIRLHKSF